MKRLSLLWFAALACISLSAAAEVPRPQIRIHGVLYPVYTCFKDVKPTSTVNPQYPYAARQDQRGGEVHAGVVVDAKGQVTATFIVKGGVDHDVQQAVLRALGQWRFPVLKEHGAPIAYAALVTIVMQPD